MPSWFISEAFQNLWITDTPMEYTPAYGPAVKLRLAHHERSQPSIVSWVSWQGAGVADGADDGWSCSWLSFAELDDAEATVDLMMPAGGWATFVFPTNSAASSANYRNNTWLEKQGPSGGVTNLLLHFPDGSIATYGVLDTSTAGAEGFAGLFYLSRMADPAGNATTFAYDSNFYLTTVTAADGTAFTLQYGMAAAVAHLITGVTASYGNSVSFGQLTNAWNLRYGGILLTNITDAAGISSQIGYQDGADGGPVTQLITPYGTTSFLTTDAYGVFDRTVQITNAVGTQEFYGLKNAYSGSSWPDFAASQIPTNTPVGTLDADSGSRQERNTFYWNAQQFVPLVGVDPGTFDWPQFKTARIRHWLASTYYTYTHFDTLSVEQAPSPDGTTEGQLTWYDYAGKPSGTDGEVGTQIMPSVIARVMPDGSTWCQSFQLLTNGLPTQAVEQWIDNGVALSRTTSLLYAGNNTDLLAWTNALGIAAQVNVFNAYHQVATNYDALGQMTTYSYDGTTHQLTGASFPSGLSTSYTYDGSHRLQQVVDQPIGRTNSYTWNSDGTVASHTDERGLTVDDFWDGLHRFTGVVYPDGTTISNRYDLVNGTPYPNSSGGTAILDLTATKDRLGYWTYFAYDALRRRIFDTNANGVITAYGYCDCGSISSMTNALGTPVQQATIYNRDYQANLTSTYNADGYNATNFYDSLARITATGDGWGYRWFNYNNLGLLTSVSNACGLEQQTVYDLLDRPSYATDANGVTITNVYDNLNRLLTRGYPDGGVEKFGYSALGLVAYTNQIGCSNFFAYDAASRKTFETNANGEVIRYTNNAAGDLLSLTDGKNQTTRWHYDQYGLVTNKLDQAGTEILRYNYDADSHLTNRWSAAKGNTGYAYDLVGNLTNIAYPASGAVKFTYDALNRLTNMVDAAGTTKYTYTAGNQLLTEDGPFASDTVTNTYSNRRRIALAVAEPTLLGTTVAVWTNGFGWDLAGRLTNVTSQAGAFGYTYAALGSGFSGRLLQELNLPGGASVTNFYDPVSRLLGTLLRNSGGSTLDAALYGYTSNSQRTGYTNAAGAFNHYTYDPIGQLTVATSSTNSEARGYAYDAAWNMAWRTNGGTIALAYHADVKNELTNAAPVGTLNYDANGNLTNSSALLCEYDDENRLSAVEAGLWRTEFEYDGLGRLRFRLEYVLTAEDGGWAFEFDHAVEYVYDGWRVIQERTESGDPGVSYKRGLDLSGTLEGAGGIGGLLARSSAWGSTNWASHAYYHADGNGNITCLIDTNQSVVASYRYDPFGNTLSQSGSLADANTYRFSSKEIHTNTLLYYYGYRFYDPNLQRWLNRDPLGEWDDINLYAFAYNNPECYVDSDGLQIIEPPPAKPKPKPTPPPTPGKPKPKPPVGKPKPPTIPKPKPLPKPKPFPFPRLCIYIGEVLDPPALGDPDHVECERARSTPERCYYICTWDTGPSYTIWVPNPTGTVPCPETPPAYPGPNTPAPQPLPGAPSH